MWVTHLSLTNYRNYVQADIALKQGLNLFLGKNGQGKTNVVEAIAYFASLSSHRTTQDVALINKSADSAVARLSVRRLGRDVLLELQLNKNQPNKAQLNRVAVKPKELISYFSCVVFAPEDLLIVRGEPAVRRKFLDEVLIARKPSLVQVLNDYERVVKQRTTLLKTAKGIKPNIPAVSTDHLSTLEVWNDRLIQLGSRIMAERENLIAELKNPLAQAYEALVGSNHHPRLSMSTTVVLTNTDDENDVPRETSQIEKNFRAQLATVFDQERERGVTLLGPHRDDLVLQLNDLPVKGYASHGESWSFVLALRLAVARLLQAESTAGDPVVILDDVFAELDSSRRERLFHAISAFEQIIVTAAVEADVPQDMSWNVINIANGQVVQPTNVDTSS